MFVVGLLLYLGETVFQNAGEGTFTVKVKTPTEAIIDVSDCKGSETLGDFMKKFEKAYTEKINDWKINDEKIEGRIYFLIFQGKCLFNNDPNERAKTLAELKIGKDCTLLFGFRSNIPAETVYEYNITKKNEDLSTSTCPCSRVCRLCGC